MPIIKASPITVFLLRLPVGHGRVVNSPRFCFFYLSMSKVGLPLLGDTAGFFPVFCCLAHCYISFKPIFWQNMSTKHTFNMYAEISKRKQGFPCKNSHQRCFETTNFDRLHREAASYPGAPLFL